MGRKNSNVSASAVVAVTTTYKKASLEPVPDQCYLDTLIGQIDSIAGGATKVTWFISSDSKGDNAITDAVEETIITGQITATDGGIATKIDMQYSLLAAGVSTGLYVWMKTDAGTLNLTAAVMISEEG